MRALYEEYKIILERKNSIGDPGGQSYTRYLFNEGINKILKKIGEESAELIVAAKDAGTEGGAGRVVGETADLLYHVLVMLAELGLGLSDVEAELEARAAKRGNLKRAKEVDKST